MNELSWILYLAGVAGSAKPMLEFLCAATAFITLIFLIFGTAAVQMGDILKSTYIHVMSVLFSSLLLSGLLFILTPSKDTVYAIAVSQVGEQVYKSEVGQKATEALKAWLDKQIADAKGAGK